MSYIEYKRNKSIYKVGDISDKLYLIIRGQVNIYKPVKIKVKMSFKDYLLYCLLLNKYKEEYLLNKMLMTYVKIIPIMFIDEIKKAFNILFRLKLLKKLHKKKITNNRELNDYFEKNLMNCDDFNINFRQLDLIRKKNSQKDILNLKDGNGNNKEQEWENYILKNCEISLMDMNYLEKFDDFLKNKKKMDIECYIFEYANSIQKGQYFGDLPIDNNGSFLKKKREYTIFAEEDTIIGCIKNEDFIYIIAPKIKIEKLKNIYFINENYFFKAINNYIFTKNYFQHFIRHEINRDNIIFDINSIPKSLFLLQKGNISLSIQCSLIQLNDIIAELYEKLITSKYYSEIINKKLISKEVFDTITKYANDYFLKNFKLHDEKFIEEIKLNRIFQISIISTDEIIGLEEIFFNIPYRMKGVVSSEKCIYYELPIDKLDYILNIETNLEDLYIKTSVNKLLSLIERLHNLKQSVIDIIKNREIINKNNNNNKYIMEQSISNIDNNQNSLIKMNINNTEISMEKNNLKIINNDNSDNNNENITNINTEKILYNQGIYKPYKRGFSSIKKQKINYSILENIKNEEKKDDNNNSINYKLENGKHLKYAKSARKLTNKKINLFIETIEETERIDSADFYKLKNKIKKDNNTVDAIFIIDKYYTLEGIKKSIERNKNKIEIVNKLYKNQNIKSKTIDKKKIKRIDDENEEDLKNEIENINSDNNHKSINPDKDIDYNLYKRINLKLNIKNSFKNFKTINNEYRHNIFKKSIDNKYSNNKNISNFQKSDDNKVINEDNNNNRLIISHNFLFSKSPSQLPKLNLEFQNNKSINLNYVKNCSSGVIMDNMILKTKKAIIPKIVKNFYDNKKIKGYIPYIANKESNTVFLRKYHNKYNNKILNTEGNLKILPKIYKHIPISK